MIDELILSLVPTETAQPLDRDSRELLTQKLELFLRGGGAVSLDTWRRLGDESRIALAHAGDRVAHQRAREWAQEILHELEQAAGDPVVDALKDAAERALEPSGGPEARAAHE